MKSKAKLIGKNSLDREIPEKTNSKQSKAEKLVKILKVI